jgi:hypothetical protein
MISVHQDPAAEMVSREEEEEHGSPIDVIGADVSKDGSISCSVGEEIKGQITNMIGS